MNKQKLLTIAVVSLLILNFGILAILFFRPGGPPHDHPPGGPNGGPRMIIIERLKLDGSQQEQYEMLIKEHRSKMDSLQHNDMQLKDQLYGLLRRNNNSGIAAADSITTRIAANQKMMEEVTFDHFRKIKNICKGEQLQLFDELIDNLGRLFAPPR